MSSDQTGELSRAVSQQLSEEQARRAQAKEMLLRVLQDAPGHDLRREMLGRGFDPGETFAALRELEHEGIVELNDYQYQLAAR
jgi:hypothetical protein